MLNNIINLLYENIFSSKQYAALKVGFFHRKKRPKIEETSCFTFFDRYHGNRVDFDFFPSLKV